MTLIGVGDMLNKAVAMVIARIVAVLVVRLTAVIASMGISFLGLRDFLEKVRLAAGPAGQEGSLGDIFQNLPPEAVMQALMTPMLWVAIAVNILIFLWAQAGVYLALYPNLHSSGAGSERSIAAVIKEACGFIFPMLIINIIFGVAVTVGMILLIIPGVFLAVKYGFSPWLVVCENRSAMAAWRRSGELVKDYWWPVFGRLLVALIITFIGNLVLGFIPVVGGIIAGVIFPPFLSACQLAVLESLKEIKGNSDIV